MKPKKKRKQRAKDKKDKAIERGIVFSCLERNMTAWFNEGNLCMWSKNSVSVES